MPRGVAPGEATYTPQVMPEDLPRKITPEIHEGSPVGAALERFGDTLAQKYQRDSALWAGDQVAALRVKAVKSLEDAKANAPSGDPGNFTEQYLQDFDKQSAPLVEAASRNPYAGAMVQKGLSELRDTLATHSMAWEATQRVAARTDSIDKNLTSQLPIVEAHPELSTQVGSTLMDQINNSGADPSARLKMARTMHEQLSLATANGMARLDPRGVIEGLNDPDHAPDALRGLNDAQREAVRTKANGHLADPIMNALTDGRLGDAQHLLTKAREVMEPRTAYGLQATIDSKIKEKQNEAKQDIADRFSDSLQAATYGLPNAITVSRGELEILYPHDAQRHWDQLQATVQAGAKAREYDQMTPAQIEADLKKHEPTQGGPEAALNIRIYSGLASAAERSMKSRISDPAQFAIDSGSGWHPIDFTKPDEAASELRRRAMTAPQISERTGVQIPLLTNAESRGMSTALAAQPPTSQLGTLVQLHNAFPDERSYYSVLAQIAPHSPVTAIAGAKVSPPSAAAAPAWYDDHFAANPADAEHILTGERLLNPPKGEATEKGRTKESFPMPADGGPSGLREHFATAARDMFRDRPELGEAYFGAFKAAYASLLSEKGDMSGNGSHQLEQRALQMVLGSRYELNGRTLSVPSGMDPTRFKGNVERAVASAAADYGAPKDWEDRISGYSLREIGALGSGRYELVNGSTPLMRPDGLGIFTIDLGEQFRTDPRARKGVIER
jgi:hypothetical protein